MSCFTWSNLDTKFNPLCTNTLLAEVSNLAKTCEACVVPTRHTPSPCGYVLYQWTNLGIFYVWTQIDITCSGGCVAPPPGADGTVDNEVRQLDCI